MNSLNLNINEWRECLVKNIHLMIETPEGRASLKNIATLGKVIAAAGVLYAGFGVVSAWKWISRHPIAGVVAGGTCAISAIAFFDVMLCSHAIELLCKKVCEISVERISQAIENNSFVLGDPRLIW